MNWKQIVLALVLVDFIGASAWALSEHGGLIEMFAEVFATPAGIQVAFDFAILYALGLVWMWRDAKAKGLSPLGWVAGAALTGSPGFLVYLIRRERLAA